MFLLLIVSGCCLAKGIPLTEEKQTSEILTRLEAKIEKQDAVINELLGVSGDRAVRDLPYIMMCAYKDQATSTGIIAYDELTLDYSNCDRPGETLLKQCPNPYLPRWSLFINGYCQWNFYSRDRRALHNHLLWNG